MPANINITKIALLITGDEILKGDIIDTNSNFLCSQIAELKHRVTQIFICGDDLPTIVNLIQQISTEFDFLIMTGGLGPTEDDYTYQAISLATNQELIRNKQAEKNLKRYLKNRSKKNFEINLKQCFLPESAKIISNTTGSASGAYLMYKRCLIFCTPGVPTELESMWYGFVRDKISKKLGSKTTETRYIRTFGLGEASIQSSFQQGLIKSNSNQKIGFRAHFPYVDCKLSFSRHMNDEDKKIFLTIQQIILDYAVSYPDIKTIDNIVTEKLIANDCKLSVAESVSGGLISSLVTSNPGASKVMDYGVVAYTDFAKTELLKVPSKLIQSKTAVSYEVVMAMLEGIVNLSVPDFAVATSGYANPTSIKDDLGIVFIGWYQKRSGEDFFYVRQFKLSGNRERIQKLAAYVALDGLRRLLFDFPIFDVAYNFDLRSNNEV